MKRERRNLTLSRLSNPATFNFSWLPHSPIRQVQDIRQEAPCAEEMQGTLICEPEAVEDFGHQFLDAFLGVAHPPEHRQASLLGLQATRGGNARLPQYFYGRFSHAGKGVGGRQPHLPAQPAGQAGARVELNAVLLKQV